MDGGGKGTGELTERKFELDSSFLRFDEFAVKWFFCPIILLSDMFEKITFVVEFESSTDTPRIRLPLSGRKYVITNRLFNSGRLYNHKCVTSIFIHTW